MARPIDSSKLCDENGCADTQAWEEYQEMLGKAANGASRHAAAAPPELQIQEGRRYVLRDGRIVGPLVMCPPRHWHANDVWYDPAAHDSWRKDGAFDPKQGETCNDIVTEYQDILGKAVAGDRAQVYRDTSSLGYGGTPAPATLSALPDLTLPIDSDERKEIPLVDGCLAYFPAALAGVARVSKIGNDKHNPDEPLHHARGKSMDHANCLVRHLTDVLDLQALFERTPSVAEMDRAGEAILEEASYLAWRALALSQALHERYGSAPLAPAARE